MELGFGGRGRLAGDVASGALDSIRDGEQGNCPIDDGCVCSISFVFILRFVIYAFRSMGVPGFKSVLFL